MNKEISDFIAGIFFGLLMACAIVVCAGVIKWKSETTGYENKLIIKYHNPTQEYDRELVRNMVNGSGIQTNFVEKSIKMDKHWIEYRMTNPIK